MLNTPRAYVEFSDIAAAFVHRLDELYGLYLDTTAGFNAALKQFDQLQTQTAADLKMTRHQLDSTDFFFGKGDPNDPQNILQHRTTQGEYRRRNSPSGSNYSRLAQYLVILVFHLWEQEYRVLLAEALGVDKATIRLPVIGDLRRLRNEILKHRGVVSASTARALEVIKFAEGDSIVFTPDQIFQVVRTVKAGIDTLVQDHTSHDPKHRTVWHIH
ncbi:MAG: hypothetical protein Rubg2KO_17140 [Rubricoccaceae bacterium]